MSLRLSVCSTMPCQLFSGEAWSEVWSPATAILFSLSRDDFSFATSSWAHDLRANALRLSRGKNRCHFSGSCALVRRNLTPSAGLSTCPGRYRDLHTAAVL